MKKNKKKYKYSIWQNICFMLHTAWSSYQGVIWCSFFLIAINVTLQVVQMLVSPIVLSKIESYVPVKELLITIILFAGVQFTLKTLSTYIDHIWFMKKINVRMEIIAMLNRKCFQTSYPNSKDAEFLKLQGQAYAATQGNSQATERIWVVLTELITNVCGFLAYLAILSQFQWMLLLVIIVMVFISFFVNKYITDWIYREGRLEEQARYRTEIDYVNARAEDMVLAKDIRIFGLGNWLQELYGKSLRMYQNFLYRREKTYVWSSILDTVLTFLKNGIAYFYLVYNVLSQGLTASEFLLYFSALSGFSIWVTGILEQFIQLKKACVDISYVQEYLHRPEPFRFEGGAELPKAENYELRLEHVSFTYPGAKEPIFKDLNLTILPGEKVAIVGLNGAGKTTLVKLLCGFYDPDEGRVLLNGIDIRTFNRQEYYQLFSAVFQEHFLLDVTIAEQVAQSTEDIDFEKVLHCLKKAGLAEQMEALPRGLNTHMGREVYSEGILLSGGQMQRLLLARALYKDGAILILDEPTAALDPIAEHDIYTKYHELTRNKTALFISHRLASTRFCDRILFVAEGKIAEEGTHESLLAAQGAYAELFEVQSRYYREGGEY